MSTETKFTPGPWAVYGDWGIKDSSGRLIAQYEPLCSDIDIGNTDESFSNAHLIAAAPELLSLLEEARSTLEMWKDVAPAVSLCADIDKALAKARGES